MSNAAQPHTDAPEVGLADGLPEGLVDGAVKSAGAVRQEVVSIPKRHKFTIFLIAACAISITATAMLWIKLSNIQEALARQSADSAAQSIEARLLAKTAQELSQQTAARQASTETRLSEVALQRGQLDELMQNLSRSRDENLVVDIESALRLAQQQAQLTGSAEPLLAALKSADQRLVRAAQPRLTPLLRAIAKDTERVKATTLADTPGLLIKLDELARMLDDVPLGNKVGLAGSGAASGAGASAGVGVGVGGGAIQAVKKPPAATKNANTSPPDAIKTEAVSALSTWALGFLSVFKDEARNLVRVSRIDSPEAALLSPEQGFFVRENLKLRVLNARLGLLARQTDASRNDLATVANVLDKYFDTKARSTQQASSLVQQLQTQLRATELPRIDDTLAALTTAAAGR